MLTIVYRSEGGTSEDVKGRSKNKEGQGKENVKADPKQYVFPCKYVRHHLNFGHYRALVNPEENPFDEIIKALTPLPRIKDYLKSRDIPDHVPTFNIVLAFRNNFPVLRYTHILSL